MSAPTTEPTKELIAAIERRLRTATQALNEVHDLLAEVGGQRRIPEKDANGEPTWTYAIKCRIPADIFLTTVFSEYALEWGFNEQSAKTLFYGAEPGSGSSYEGFKRYYERVGTKWSHWTKVWQKWVRSEHERKTKANGHQQQYGRATRHERTAILKR